MAKRNINDISLEYAIAHHTQSNPPEDYQVKNLTDFNGLRTGFYPVAWDMIGLPEDFTGQEFGSMVMVVKFTRTIIYFVLFPWDGSCLYYARGSSGTIPWKKIAFSE